MKTFIYFYRTFLSTGIQTVLPQLFIMAYVPLHRSELLPLCLLLASISSIGGIAASRHLSRYFYGGPVDGRAAIGIGLSALVGAGVISMFLTHDWPIYFIAVALVSGLLELLFNMLDHRYVEELSGIEFKAHASRVTVVQLIALTAAPFYFTFTVDMVWLQVLLAAGGSAMLVALMLSSASAAKQGQTVLAMDTADRPARAASGANRLRTRDFAFLLYALAVYVAVFIFSSHLIYILHDYYGMTGATWKGGLLLGIGNLVAVAVVLGCFRVKSAQMVRKSHAKAVVSSTALPARTHAAVVACLLASAVLLYGRWLTGFAFILALACLVGGAFGIFQLLAREYASRRAVGEGAGIVLTSYNNLKNIASLVGFSSALALASASSRLHIEYVRLVILAVIVCILAACMALAVIPALGIPQEEEKQ
ncbi:hypothetical protein ACFPVX_02825 [Cohnella faecalis]|uniref:MFS transporter n=1 Tax=Cohnella faecalis TaxID=2315694 RepID=A0A398CVC4_9BACL|nr:hypothetical protein [Cohnella faecalis]RIE05249.1 hypothetical protein D3H35_01635 [Cohnella faecalis]